MASSNTMNGVAALNVYKKVAVIRKSTDVLTYEDGEGNTKSISDLHLAAGASTPHLKVKKQKGDIPVPKIKDVKSYKTDISATYKAPLSFVRYQKPSAQELFEKTEYVMDAEDEVWLINNAKFGGSIPEPVPPAVVVEEVEAKVIPEVKAAVEEAMKVDNDTATNDATNDTTSKAQNSAQNSEESESRKRSLEQREQTQTQQAPQSEQQQKQPEHKKTMELPLFMFEIMIDVMEKATAFDTIIRKDHAEKLILERLPKLYHMYPVKATAGVVKIKDVVQDVYNYWVSKRSKLKRPLLRRFWPVTSSDDTNPHLVFRPREKEKYKLRKKRQNDMDTYRKMQLLKQDFEHLRELVQLVKKREELNQSFILLQREWFRQKIYDYVDTSGAPRVSDTLSKKELDELLKLELPYDLNGGRRVRRTSTTMSGSNGTTTSANGLFLQGTGTNAIPKIIAGQNHGEPAPNFLQPLETREQYVMDWDYSVPHVTAYVDSLPEPTFRYRHRPRMGRGGRIMIDRLPLPPNPNATTFLRACGQPTASQLEKRGPVDIMPPPLDYDALRKKVDTIAMTALQEEYDTLTSPRPAGKGGATPMVDEENDGTTVVVSMKDWLSTDEQLWGEERYALGPI
ncbi:unnamed protein product [Cylindrotheca closterium]|uniref:Enhancer of polycomb-like protein n=1 Tax=Cylindrotheca closterium TaxID=2856 RepID=A0AAD2G4J3_9STRA|nr:unnamed protein product [Cylindrotheca closterium]